LIEPDDLRLILVPEV